MKTTYTADMVSRNVKQLGDGVIEVRRYNDGHMRADFSWVWFLATMGVTIYDYFTSQSMFRDIQWVISVDWALESVWKRYSDTFSLLGEIMPDNAYEEFKAEMIKMHGSNFYHGLFYILFPLFWFYMVISPRWRPVRFDAKRRLVYFWDWGQLYIVQYPRKAKLNHLFLSEKIEPKMNHSWIRRAEHGSLVIKLPHANPNRKWKRSIHLGIYRPACPYQNRALLEFILDYLCSYEPDKEYAPYFKKQKRIASDYFNWFYQFSLFPQRGYNEKKTEAKIQEWLAKYGDNDAF